VATPEELMARRYTLDIQGTTFSLDVEETDVDRFEVVVGGQKYEVRLAGDEDLPEAKITPAFEPGRVPHGVPAGAARVSASPSGSAAARSPPRAAPAPVPRRAAARPGASGGTLAAPMPGVILDVMVKAGDSVTRGQEIAVLEAMKMQNTIRSPRDGTIAEVCVTPGHAIGHGDAIVRYQES
jgi:biotin carboxyl carrier protein